MCIPAYVHSWRGSGPHWRIVHDGGRLRRVDGEACGGRALRGNRPAVGTDGVGIVKKTVITAAVAVVAGCALAGCSVSTPAPAESSQAGPSSSAPALETKGSSPSGTGTASQGANAAATREACELFNKLVADYGAVSPTDSNGYEDVYLKAQDAKDTVSGDLRGLFSSLGLLALDKSSAAESSGKPAKESQDAVRDAVFANSAACTAAGVTLRL